MVSTLTVVICRKGETRTRKVEFKLQTQPSLSIATHHRYFACESLQHPYHIIDSNVLSRMHRLATRRRTKLISQAFTNRACKPQQALPRFNKLTTNLLPFAFQQKLQLNKLSLATRVPSTSNSLVFTSRFNGSTHTQPVIFTTWTHNRQFSSISGPRKQKESGYNTNNKQQQKPEVDEEFAADPVETLPPELCVNALYTITNAHPH